jgi:Cytochrome P460
MSSRLLAKVSTATLVLIAAVGYAQVPSSAAGARPSGGKEWSTASEGPAYTEDGRLKYPEHYREWVYLSSGLDMSYTERSDMAGHSMFDNVFAEPEAYREFVRTGHWPEGTVLALEVRTAAEKGSINKHGRFQTSDLMGFEVHVRDTKRFPGGWAFFNFRGPEPAKMIPMSEDCYACHRDHAAVDTTFVQFYPTLLPIATQKGTLSPNYQP